MKPRRWNKGTIPIQVDQITDDRLIAEHNAAIDALEALQRKHDALLYENKACHAEKDALRAELADERAEHQRRCGCLFNDKHERDETCAFHMTREADAEVGRALGVLMNSEKGINDLEAILLYPTNWQTKVLAAARTVEGK